MHAGAASPIKPKCHCNIYQFDIMIMLMRCVVVAVEEHILISPPSADLLLGCINEKAEAGKVVREHFMMEALFSIN